MTRKSFYLVAYGGMAFVIVAAQIVGALVPSVPAFAYLLSGLAAGAALMLVLARLKRGSRIVVSDERSRGIAEFAAAASFRVVLFGLILFVSIVFSIPGIGCEWVAAGRALIAVMLAQLVVFYIAYVYKSRKS